MVADCVADAGREVLMDKLSVVICGRAQPTDVADTAAYHVRGGSQLLLERHGSLSSVFRVALTWNQSIEHSVARACELLDKVVQDTLSHSICSRCDGDNSPNDRKFWRIRTQEGTIGCGCLIFIWQWLIQEFISSVNQILRLQRSAGPKCSRINVSGAVVVENDLSTPSVSD